MKKSDLLLYAITDSRFLKKDETLKEKVKEAILGGATFIQLREKNMEGEALKELAIGLQEVCRKYSIPFVINDDVWLAKEIGADGVHVGQEDMSVSAARAILGPEKIVGATAKTIEQAKKAEEEGANYIGSGAIFATETKCDAKPLSFTDFQNICHAVTIPVVAIGGINIENIKKLQGLDLAGVAVVSSIFSEKNIVKATMELKNEAERLIQK